MFIPAPHGQLEATFREGDDPVRGAAVFCHPHPLHGGTMHTKAVYRAAQALNESGFDVLRFNFRGVGASTGSYGEGVDEIEDVDAALDWLRARDPRRPILVGGFSFGSLVGLRAGLGADGVRALLALGIPVRMYDFGFLEGAGVPIHVVQGENDEFGPGPEIQEVVESMGAGVTLDRIPGADHYFNGHFEELKVAVKGYVSGGAATAAFPETGA